MKTRYFLYAAALIFAAISCNDKNLDPENPDDPDIPVEPADTTSNYIAGVDTVGLIRDSATISIFWKDKYAGGGIDSPADIIAAKYFKNGEYTAPEERKNATNHYCLEFWGKKQLRFVNLGAGYAVSVPHDNGTIGLDYTLCRYGMKFTGEDYKLRVTMESVRPYATNEDGYNTYLSSWLTRYFASKKFQSVNTLITTDDAIEEDETILDGYAVSVWSVKIGQSGDIKMPYYHIAIIRPSGQYAKFGLLLYKTSQERRRNAFLEIVKTWASYTSYGVSQNYFPVQEVRENPLWNDETRNFYHKLQTQKSLSYGVFTKCVIETTDAEYDTRMQYLIDEQARLKEAMGHEFELLPTYAPTSWYGTRFYFPVEMATALAGGNGFNGKPVLQYSYQFTNNNNGMGDVFTPVYSIYRGVYDDYFVELAQSIKAYGHPVLFRLNNEMNSDWVTYCGLMSMIDPEIFCENWRRLYDIFTEQGVDNCIWIWDPVLTSTPYSNWGEDLCYYPGNDYVQMAGVSTYESGNGTTFQSFEDLWTQFYDKKSKYFLAMPWAIGEHGCGSGGSASGALMRNASKQANWVKEQFADFADRDANPYLANIKTAVWFSCNDGEGDNIQNYYILDSRLTETFDAFKTGFKNLEKKYGDD